MRGVVKWYNTHKGFGWISLADGEDVYVHQSVIPSGSTLNAGDEVELETLEGPAGKQAIRLKLRSTSRTRRPRGV